MPPSEFWNRWKDITVNSLRKRGLRGTVKRANAHCKLLIVHQWKLYFTWSPWNPWYCYLDKRFDRRFAVDTAGVLILPEVHSDPRFNGYSPTPHSIFFRLLRQVDVEYSKFTFIDFGCGKGKVLLLAASLPFKQIIGIELSTKLIRVVEKNLNSYRGKTACQNVRLACIDAREFQIPDERTIFYFYDPFEAELMVRILHNIWQSIAATPREIYILYFIPVHRRLLDESGFLSMVKETSRYCIYRATGPHSRLSG
jgi:tRNA G46 methylase TrmB